MKDNRRTAELQADMESIADIIQLILELDELDRGRIKARAEILLEEPKYFKRTFKLIVNQDKTTMGGQHTNDRSINNKNTRRHRKLN